ncbi:MAG: adenylosuccinate synthase [Candidatus Marinimicrobia bacterium]|nr:adenylosuccinate synthase [Candidatus Neomarinimicrobiota bacterium]
MAISAIIGGQWGDEGKGKIVDLLSKDAKIVARYQGGANAGHTVYHGDLKVVLHQIPSGILRSGCHCILGNGMVVDPIGLMEEIKMVQSHGFDTTGQIHVAMNAHIVTPVHKAVDVATEAANNNRIGTTGRGIGPTYVDKYDRVGIRGVDLLDANSLREKVDAKLHSAIASGHLPQDAKNQLQEQFQEFMDCAAQVALLVSDTFALIHEFVERGENILIEGAQGTLLDVDHGTYPFVTSSSASSAGISTGLGLPTTKVETIIGILKAYTTRVGTGPFPTELFDDDGQKLRDLGYEYGATTGRPRRCGWLDGVAGLYSARVNGLTDIALTKLDILDHFEEINVCVAYKVDGKVVKNMSEVLHRLEDVEPIYETRNGWMSTTTGIEKFEDLPQAAQDYITYLESLMNTRVSIISTGPGRDEILRR